MTLTTKQNILSKLQYFCMVCKIVGFDFSKYP